MKRILPGITGFFAAVLVFSGGCIDHRLAIAAEAGPRSSAGEPGAAARARALAAIASHAYRHGVRLDVGHDAIRASSDSVTDLYLRYGKAVGFGQMEPQAVHIPWDIARSVFDPGPARAALIRGGIEDALASLSPPHPQYGRLVEALARYREIAARGGWPEIPNGPVLGLGVDGFRVLLLRRRLAVVGDLPGSDADGRIFDPRLDQAVIRFQRRHGLEPDGRVGPKTLAALNVPVAERIAQIIANLERWRWMPRTLPLPRLEVNVAAAELKAVDAQGDSLRMHVVVGSPRHPTPLLESEIRTVIINPPWNVPMSIWRNEMLPQLRRDPTYLAANDMRIVGRSHDPYGLEIDWRRREAVPPGIRIRQQPGPRNALGRVKFEIPNRFDVFLHDTPTTSVFKRAERALSHGCVRLEKPDMLLRYLFRSSGVPPRLPAEGDSEPRRTQAVPVAVPLPVFLVYWTSFVAPDGTVEFRKDIYGHDARMTALLARRDKGLREMLLAGGCSTNSPQS